MQVRAKETCFIGGNRRKKGDVFEFDGKPSGPIEAVEAEKKTETKKAEDEGFTNKELQAQLDAAGVKYGPNDNKATLTALLTEAVKKAAPASSGVPSKNPLDGGSVR